MPEIATHESIPVLSLVVSFVLIVIVIFFGALHRILKMHQRDREAVEARHREHAERMATKYESTLDRVNGVVKECTEAHREGRVAFERLATELGRRS